MRRSAEATAHPLTVENVTTLRHELILLYLAVEAVSDSQLRLTFRSSTPERLEVCHAVHHTGRVCVSVARPGIESGPTASEADMRSGTLL